VEDVARAARRGRLYYVHISAPDRGAAREEVLTKQELGRHRIPVPDPSRDVADRVNRSGRS